MSSGLTCRDTVAKINTTARVLTFGVVPPDNTIGAGDIFTKDRFISKSGTPKPHPDHSVSLTQWPIEFGGSRLLPLEVLLHGPADLHARLCGLVHHDAH
jgi:hypothetical protein